MSYKLTTNEKETVTITSCKQMKIGDLAIIEKTPYKSQILLRTYSGWVSLTNPNTTWTGSTSLQVSPIPSGTKIILTVE